MLLGDRSWYRQEAKRLRDRAVAIRDEHWRDSHLRLARAFERIADVLDEDRRRTETSADRRP
jgi:hypothetical protein